MVGGDYTPRNLECLAVEGRLVQIAFLHGSKSELSLLPVLQKRLTITGSTLRPRSVEDKGADRGRLAEGGLAAPRPRCRSAGDPRHVSPGRGRAGAPGPRGRRPRRQARPPRAIVGFSEDRWRSRPSSTGCAPSPNGSTPTPRCAPRPSFASPRPTPISFEASSARIRRRGCGGPRSRSSPMRPSSRDIARDDQDGGVREEATARLVALAVHAHDDASAEAALALLADQRHLAEVAKSAPREATRRAAVGRLHDAKALATVVRECEDPGTKLAALGRIDDPAVLAGLAQKSDVKAVALAAVETSHGPGRARDRREPRPGARRGQEGASPAGHGPALGAAPGRGRPSRPEPRCGRHEREAYERERARLEQRSPRARGGPAGPRGDLRGVGLASGSEALRALETARAAWAALPPWTGTRSRGPRAPLRRGGPGRCGPARGLRGRRSPPRRARHALHPGRGDRGNGRPGFGRGRVRAPPGPVAAAGDRGRHSG